MSLTFFYRSDHGIICIGKLCIFAHHLDVLDEIGRGAGLSNRNESSSKYIRIDGTTRPKARQEQIVSFQTNPTVRVALLGITVSVSYYYFVVNFVAPLPHTPQTPMPFVLTTRRQG